MRQPTLRVSGSNPNVPSMGTAKVSVGGFSVAVPSLLDECMCYIFANGLVEGIFRVSGSARRMKDVAEDYSLFHDWLYSQEKQPNVHDVCGVVKKYMRDYIDSMNGLFSPQVLKDILREYDSHCHKGEDSTEGSFKSANSSVGSYSLLSAMELEADLTAIDTDGFVDAFARYIMVNNLESKNLFFIYWLSIMKRLSFHQELTKMSVSNLSIIFQPYLFHNANIDDLQKFRSILTVLVEKFDAFVDRFACYEKIIGGLHTLDHDEMSLSPNASIAASPLTIYSSCHGSSPKANNDTRRKASISNRLSVFWDNYNIPANRPKRMSFLSAKSNDKFASSENLGIDNYFSIPVKEKHQTDNYNIIPTVPGPSKQSQTGATEYFSSPNGELDLQELESLASKRNKRKSFFEYFRSSLTLNSQENLSSGIPTSPLTPTSLGPGLLKHLLTDSVDDLPTSKAKSPNTPEGKKLFGRTFSLRFKKKSN